ncbi:MAG: hypothetical protein K8F29_11015 [Kofleriaceae bacterium]|nr:hypothetical protein [Candidatus Methylomirabilis lanthanidiphila]
MRGNGFVDPGADRSGMTVGLALEVGVVGMNQTQDEERIDQQVKTDCRCGERP